MSSLKEIALEKRKEKQEDKLVDENNGRIEKKTYLIFSYVLSLSPSSYFIFVAYLFLEWNIKGITDSLAATMVTPQIANNSSNPVRLAFFMSLKYLSLFLFLFDLFRITITIILII